MFRRGLDVLPDRWLSTAPENVAYLYVAPAISIPDLTVKNEFATLQKNLLKSRQYQNAKEVPMLWAIYCIDKPNSAPLRAEHQQRHSAYLKEKDPVIFFTGPLQSDDGTGNVGSLWIIAANSRAEAQTFVDGEAFYRAGVFESVAVRRVRKGHFHPELADSK